MVDPFDARFWKEYAEKSNDTEAVKRGQQASLWNTYGKRFNKFDDHTGYLKTVQEVVEALEHHGVLQPFNTVLDVACGSGAFSVPFASLVKEVTCVDISPVMTKMLEEEAAARNITNIHLVCSDWFSYRNGMSHDLVFCGMGPVLDDVRSIDRMLGLSRRYVSLVYWAGHYEHGLFSQFYRMATGKEIPWVALNAVVIFNYLVSMGYSPEIKFLHSAWQMEADAGELVSYLLWALSFYKDTGCKDKEIAENLVRKAARNDIVQDLTRARLAFIFLDKGVGNPSVAPAHIPSVNYVHPSGVS